MDDLMLLDAAERYINGEMSEAERTYFEQLRRDTPEVDQLVVEHRLFLGQMNEYSTHRTLRHSFVEAHSALLEKGLINDGNFVTRKARVIQLWKRYKKTTAIAASIACVTALTISALISYLTPNKNESKIDLLDNKIKIQDRKIRQLENQQKQLPEPKIPSSVTEITGGTGFMIDVKGYLVTNAHVLKGEYVVVKNKNGEYKAKVAFIDKVKDLAILKIEDQDFKSPKALPYAIRRRSSDLGEELFTLGYPRTEIVYNRGYLSAKTGYNGDTLNCQLSLNANHGNSGGPVFSQNGDIIGVVSSREMADNDVVFAIRSKQIFDVVDELKKTDTAHKSIKLPLSSGFKSNDRVEQVKQVEDYVYFIQSFNN
jgi:serine protease Do